MLEVAKIVTEIGSVSSSISKLEILKRNKGNEALRSVLKFIYNPYCKTGISTSKLNKVGALRHTVGVPNPIITYDMAIDYFTKHTTGADADLAYAARFLNSVEATYDTKTVEGLEAFRLAKAIITQDLKIGVTSTSLNNAYGKDFIPKVGCMLGTLYGDVPQHQVIWPCIVTEKLDGIRRILIKENGVCRAFSRSGHEDTGLVEILAEAKYLPDNTVYDGELLAKGKFADSIALRQATNSIASSKGAKTGLTFNVFDMVPLDEFYAGKSKDAALNRKILLGATLMDDSIEHLVENCGQLIAAFGIHRELECIKPVPILGKVSSIQQVEPIVDKIWAAGGEGVMLNTTTGYYEIKRSKQLLKIKHTEEYTLKIVDIIEGSGKYEDSMGALVLSYEDAFVGVGSGFSDTMRDHIWQNKDIYIGKYVEVETFGKSKNANGGISLNCPIFKRFVGEVE
jgi:DNA ligase-1